MQPVDYFGTLIYKRKRDCYERKGQPIHVPPKINKCMYVFAQLYTDIKIPDFPAHVYYLLFRVAQTGWCGL